MLRFTCLTLLLLTACGTDPGDTQTTGGQTDTGSTAPDPDTSGAPTTSGATSDATSSSGAATGDDTSGSTAAPTTGDPLTTSTTATTGPDETTTGTATTGEPAGFDRFRLDRAAGPCPPDADCDGFIELLGTGLLRVEKFGDIPEDVTEVQISPDDLAAAAPIYGDPALFALLAQDDILCDPPTDVFESMELDVGGNLVKNTTTACTQPPLVAARDKANELADKYVP